MSTIHWRGDAAAIAQVTRVTPANVEVGDIFTLTVNNKTVSYTAAAATVADVTAGLASAWNSASAAEFAEVTATDDTTHLTLTADTPGVPFSVSASTTDGGGNDTQSLAVSEITASAGPMHWDTAANWFGGVVPADSDDVYLEHSDAPIRYGLDQSTVLLASLNIAASFTGEIGLPRVNASGATEYVEYRERYLQIGATDVAIGYGDGEGSGRLQLDTGADRTTVVVHATATATDDDWPALLWRGTHVSNAVHVRGGTVGVAATGGDAATVATLTQTGGNVLIGSGATLTTIHLSGSGRLSTRSSFSTLNQAGGQAAIAGASAATTINLTGGRLDYRSAGTIGTLTIDGADAMADFSADGRSKTVSNCTLTLGEIIDPQRCVSYGSGVVPGGRLVALGAG